MRSEIRLRFQNLWRESPIFDVPRRKRVDVAIAIPFGNLTLSPKSPTSVVFSNARVPPFGNFILSSTAPIINATYNPSFRSLVLSSFAPVITAPLTIVPLFRNLSLSSVAPTVVPIFIMPPFLNLVLSSIAPFDDISDRRIPLTQNLSLSSIAPIVTVVFTSVALNIVAGNLNAATYAPTIVVTGTGLTAPVITNLRNVSAQSTIAFWNIGTETRSSELSVIGTSNYSGSTINVFRDTVLQGTTTTDSSGNWKYSLPAVADGGPYNLTSSLISSPLSNTFPFSVNPLISLFTNVPTNSFNIGSLSWAVESAAVSYNISNPDTHTLRFEVHSGERFSGDITTIDRCEVHNSLNYQQGDTIYLTYQFMHEAGTANSAGTRLTHLELRNLDTDLPAALAHTTNKVIEFSILAEKLSLGIRYCPTNLDPNNQATSITPWTSTTDIVRGQWYRAEFYLKVINDSTGICQLWIDGVQVLNYSGAIGFGPYHNFWRTGLIRDNQASIQSLRIKNFLVFSFTLNVVVTPSDAAAGTTRNITVTAVGAAGKDPITYNTPVSAGITFTPVANQPGQWTFVL